MTFLTAIAFASALASAGVRAEPEYVTIRMEIDVNKPAGDTWAKVGGYCDIAQWYSTTRPLTCSITSGDGGIGTVRVLANGAVIEILVAKTDLSYGYTQPVKEGQFYSLYHGFVEAKPVTATTSRIIYTLMLDVSNMADKAAKDADVARRRRTFEAALANMKRIAETPQTRRANAIASDWRRSSGRLNDTSIARTFLACTLTLAAPASAQRLRRQRRWTPPSTRRSSTATGALRVIASRRSPASPVIRSSTAFNVTP